MSPAQIVFIGVAIAGYVLLRQLAARRFAQGDTRWLWVLLGAPIVAGLVLVITSVMMFSSSPLIAAFVGVAGFFLAGSSALLVRRAQRASAGTSTPDQRVDAMLGPLSDHVLLLGGAITLMAVALLVGVLVIGISGGFR